MALDFTDVVGAGDAGVTGTALISPVDDLDSSVILENERYLTFGILHFLHNDIDFKFKHLT